MRSPPNFPPDEFGWLLISILMLVTLVLIPTVAGIQRDIDREIERNRPYQVESAYTGGDSSCQ